jgi:hypothetical protein
MYHMANGGKMQLTNDNYHSPEANRAYMSWHQFQKWQECPARQSAVLAGTWQEPKRDAGRDPLMIGSYTHCRFLTPGMFQQFVASHHESIHGKGGKRYAAFDDADAMVTRLERLPELVQLRAAGKPEQIYTANLFGCEWKAQMDLVVPSNVESQPDLIIDLKTSGTFEDEWNAERKCRVPWYDIYGYWGQMAMYRRIYLECTDRIGVAMLAGVTKQDPADVQQVLMIDKERMEVEVMRVESAMPQVLRWKSGTDKPPMCGRGACDYCRAHRGWSPVTGLDVKREWSG